jgi:PAT family beta-lactamase induction signal transducer AmpG
MAEAGRGLAVYRDPRQLAILLLGFSSGLPLLLVYSTLSARLAQAGVKRADIGLLLLAQLPYNFKWVWAPLFDRVRPPLPLGQRRGWAISVQILLAAAIFALGAVDPLAHLGLLAVLAVAVAFLSASQDIVIDAFRIELLPPDSQGAGAAAVVAGYRVAMLVAGAGALEIAGNAGWFWAYGTMAILLLVGLGTFLVMKEPAPAPRHDISWRAEFEEAVIAPFRDFMRRPYWLAILIFIPLYKLGEAMAGGMAKPFYISLGFTLGEIARMSSLVAFVTTLAGGLIGGAVVARFGTLRALMICGIAQSIGNLAYVALAAAGHDPLMLAVSAASEDLTGGMAGTAFVAFVSNLTRAPYTATQFALLSSLEALGRSMLSAPGGELSQAIGWTPFFLVTTIITLPALALLHWLSKRRSIQTASQ